MKAMRKIWFIGIAALTVSACSINRLAVNAVADVLSAEGGTTFTGDDDPQLVGDALPFALKLYESLLAAAPEHRSLRISTGSSFVMYAKAFVEAEALILEDTDYQAALRELERAKRLYARASGYLDGVIAETSPTLAAAIAAKDQTAITAALTAFKVGDERLLYWDAAAILAAYALNPFDFVLGNRVFEAGKLMGRAYALNPAYGAGTIDDFYISFYGSLPSAMGGDPALARKHFELAIQKSGGKSVSPYVSAATALAIPQQDYDAFKTYLETALAIDTAADPANRLANILAQDKARALLAAAGDYFLVADGEDSEAFMSDDDFGGDIEGIDGLGKTDDDGISGEAAEESR